jgi:hypothetical protein
VALADHRPRYILGHWLDVLIGLAPFGVDIAEMIVFPMAQHADPDRIGDSPRRHSRDDLGVGGGSD